MSVRSVCVNNVSLGASENDIKEFFSFSGEIESIDLRSETQRSQIAYVTFKDPQGAEKAVILSGATIVDQSVTIDLAPDYNLPPSDPAAPTVTENQNVGEPPVAVQKAEDAVSGMLARGFTLGKDALNKAKSFDEKHKFTSSASARVASFDQKIGLSRGFSSGATMMNDKVKAMDQKLQVSEKTKTAFTTAQQTVSSAGSSIMKNRYLLTGTSWVVGAFSRVKKAAGEVGQRTKEKLAKEDGKEVADGSGQVPGTDSAKGASASRPLNENSSGVTKAAGEVEQRTEEKNAKEGMKVAVGSGQVPGTDSAKGASASLTQNENSSGVKKAAGEVEQKTKVAMAKEEGREVADGSGQVGLKENLNSA